MKKAILLISILLICTLFGSTAVYAYLIWYPGGFSPVPAYVACHSSFSSATLTATHNACLTWNGAGQGNLVYRNTATHNTTEYPTYNGKNEITKHYKGENAYLMQTFIVNTDYDALTEADIDINVTHPFGTASGCFDTQTAITHELGHLLGLRDVQTGRENIMYYQRAINEQCRTLSNDDKAGLAAIY